MSYMDLSDWSQCTQCGTCLIKCPVMKLDTKTAQTEIRALIDGRPAPNVFKSCALCFNCNSYCLNGLRPHELILQRILEKRGRKISNAIPYMLNAMPGPTFFGDLYARLNSKEKTILEKWSETPPPAKDLLFVGCIGRVSCLDIENSTVLKPLVKYGPPDLCCGELHYRAGSWVAYTDIIEKTVARFENLQIERMVCYCGSCYNFFSNIFPAAYGRNLPFTVMSLYDWVLERYDQGELTLKKPLNRKAAVSESCYVTEVDANFAGNLRRLYRAVGMEPVELQHHGEDNRCCGLASLVRNPNPMKSYFPARHQKLKEVKAAGVDRIAVNCPGCLFGLMPFKKKSWFKTVYMPEAILSAFGDTVERPLHRRVPMIMKMLGRRLPYFMRKTSAELPRIPTD